MNARHRSVTLLLSLLLLGSALSCSHSQRARTPARADQPSNYGLRLNTIKLPPGFRIAVYAKVPQAREMALGANGVVFVGTLVDRVYALVPTSGGTRAEVVTLASGLDTPNGVAYHDGALYVGEPTRILRYDDITAHLRSAPRPVALSHTFPSQSDHQLKYLKFGPDDKLYANIGAPYNIGPIHDPYATIVRLNPDGSGFEICARGVRNSEGFGWQPGTNVMWFTDNGRDYMGDNRPPDELNRAPRAGMHFGFPYVHGTDILDPEFGRGHRPSEFTPPARDLGPHVASLGMAFYTGRMFPSEYHNQILIAEHGSWNRSVPIGYRVTWVHVQGDRAVSYEPFAQGWLQGGRHWGRPVDVLVMPDGALLVSDDYAGVVYRVTYGK